MSKEAAANDRRAAEYWRGVAQADRGDARTAATNAQALTNAAPREDETSVQTKRTARRPR
jgi:hypothetical protein